MEAVKPEAAPAPATEEAERYRREDDPIVIPANVFCPPPKTTVAADFTDLKRCLLAPEVGPLQPLWQSLHSVPERV